ncbi:MAG: futalosine hydrolase, partial [Desulfonatronovibrio sp.]
GLLNASIALENFLTGNNGVSHVINIGIAGSYDLNKIPMAAVCTASGELWPEYGARHGHYFADAMELGFPMHRSKEREVWNRLNFHNQTFLKETGLNLEPFWHEGLGITVAGVCTSEEHARQLQEDFNGDMENMEGFALAYCCYLRSIPFMEIRTISNLAGSRNKKEWDFKGALGALKSVWSGLWAKHTQK